jgi:orotidine-5'-phosphate decarboxylase
MHSRSPDARATAPTLAAPVPIVALDVPSADQARSLVDRLPEADFFKVGLQLFVAAGPGLVRELTEGGRRVFLDLKYHDIPNTVAGAVRSAAELGVELLTVHAAGGAAMLRAAAEAAARSPAPPRVLAVTVLTSLGDVELAHAWGRDGVDAGAEAARLATLAREAGADGVVCSVHEVPAIRARAGYDLTVLTPGIRLAGDAAGDQARVASPAAAAAAGADYVVLGRTVTAAREPAAAYEHVLRELATAADRGAP